MKEGYVQDHVVKKELNGIYSVLNLNKDLTKLYVGGYPEIDQLNNDLKFNEFEGQMEELIIGDTPIGLWNFIEAQDNNYGAQERFI